MNQLKGKVIHIQKIDNLHYLSILIGTETIHMLTLELSSLIEVGIDVNMAIKPTNIAISKEFKQDISIDNQIRAKVIHIENGKILSSVCLTIEGIELESILSFSASQRLQLKVDDEVFALMSESNLSIVG